LELGLLVDGAVKLMIAELVVDRVPDGERRGLGSADNGAHILGHSVVEPAEDALVYHRPLWIMTVGRGGRRGKVRSDAEFADECIEETPPLGVIRFSDVKLDGEYGT
jgi:hypothetical protein